MPDQLVDSYFGADARAAVDTAQAVAREQNAGEIGSEHLLLGVVENADAELSALLAAYGLTADAVRSRMAERAVPSGDAVEHPPAFSKSTRTTLTLAFHLARQRDDRIDCADLLVGLSRARVRFVMGFFSHHDEVAEMVTAVLALHGEAG